MVQLLALVTAASSIVLVSSDEAQYQRDKTLVDQYAEEGVWDSVFVFKSERPSPEGRKTQKDFRPTHPEVGFISFTNVRLSSAMAEFIGTLLLVTAGCGTAMGVANQPGFAWILQVSLSFGLAVTALSYALSHYHLATLNTAVTLAYVLNGDISIVQGIANSLMQMFGSLMGASILIMMYPKSKDLTGILASTGVNQGWTARNAIICEAMLTLIVVFVFMETGKPGAIYPATKAMSGASPIAQGLVVFAAHTVLVPITGCSINPARSFGPAVVAKLHYDKVNTISELWIFFVAPLSGAAIAAGLWNILKVIG